MPAAADDVVANKLSVELFLLTLKATTNENNKSLLRKNKLPKEFQDARERAIIEVKGEDGGSTTGGTGVPGGLTLGVQACGTPDTHAHTVNTCTYIRMYECMNV